MESVLREVKCVACCVLNFPLRLRGNGCFYFFFSLSKFFSYLWAGEGENVFFNVLVNLRPFEAARVSPQSRRTTRRRSAALQSCRQPTGLFLTSTGWWLVGAGDSSLSTFKTWNNYGNKTAFKIKKPGCHGYMLGGGVIRSCSPPQKRNWELAAFQKERKTKKSHHGSVTAGISAVGGREFCRWGGRMVSRSLLNGPWTPRQEPTPPLTSAKISTFPPTAF